jgi:hypothetical protein
MEKNKTISSKDRNEIGLPVPLLLFSRVLEFLARKIRQEKEIKGIRIGKEEVKLFIFANDMILYLKDPKNSTKNSKIS